jgi:hypothetical protein
MINLFIDIIGFAAVPLAATGGYWFHKLIIVQPTFAPDYNFRAGYRAGKTNDTAEMVSHYNEGHERGYRQGVLDGFGQSEAAHVSAVAPASFHQEQPAPKEYTSLTAAEYESRRRRNMKAE